MSVLTSRPALRWLVPVGAAAAVLAGGVAIGAITQAADPSLPVRSPAELLADVQTARPDGLSGTVVYTADLGLPALPAGGSGSGAADLTSLLAGTHTLRVWYSEPDKARVALLGTLGETDVITNGRDVWIWNSRANQATHNTLPERDATVVQPTPTGGLTPRQLADLALGAVGPSTEVTSNSTVSVAGRDAYELVVTPRDPATLVASVRLAVDAEEKVPLRVQVFGRGYANPALEAAFTQVSFERPNDSQFTFNPPPGAQVTEGSAAGKPEDKAGPEPGDGPKQSPAMARVGSGWTTVLVMRVPAGAKTDAGLDTEPDATTGPPTDASGPGGLAVLLQQLPRVPGGRVLTSRLLSVMLTDDGRLLVGAVGPDRLAQAAADPAAQLPS